MLTKISARASKVPADRFGALTAKVSAAIGH